MCDTFLGYLNTFLSDSRTFFSGANWGAIVIPKPKLPPQICLGQYSQSQTTASVISVWDSSPSRKLPLQISLRQYSYSQTTASDLPETVFPGPNFRLRSVWDSISSRKLLPQISLRQYSYSLTTASDQSETVFPVKKAEFRSVPFLSKMVKQIEHAGSMR